MKTGRREVNVFSMVRREPGKSHWRLAFGQGSDGELLEVGKRDRRIIIKSNGERRLGSIAVQEASPNSSDDRLRRGRDDASTMFAAVGASTAPPRSGSTDAPKRIRTNLCDVQPSLFGSRVHPPLDMVFELPVPPATTQTF